ncbi:aldose reductase-like protein, partial [Dinothrombium tinctorium]
WLSETMAASLKLNNGLLMPLLGLGTWNAPPNQVYEAVRYAIEEAGYRHIDCALVYQNEDEVGKAIKYVIDKGVVKREDLFIVSKCWSTYHSRERVLLGCKESLSKLGLDYLDLYLIHWPMGFAEGGELMPRDESGKIIFSDVDFVETWQGMEDCYNAGLVKSIGLSNFNSEQIERILSMAKIKPVNNQVECHPYFNSAKLIDFCRKRDIVVTAWAPLCRPGYQGTNTQDYSLLEDAVIKAIAKKHNKTAAQVAIRYQIQRAVGVIPKSVTPSRILENSQVFDFELSAEEMAAIDKLDRGMRLFSPLEMTEGSKYNPFTIEY